MVSTPVRFGGLGIRKSEDIVLLAFLSSVHSIINHFSVTKFNMSVEQVVKSFSWEIFFDYNTTNSINTSQIHQWQSKIASTKQESEAWITVLPSKNIGTLLDNNTFRTAIALKNMVAAFVINIVLFLVKLYSKMDVMY